MAGSDERLDRLIACPVCDALLEAPELAKGCRALCPRCGQVLMDSRDRAMTQIVMLASTAMVLMVAGVFFPFLEVSVGGRVQRASLFDTILTYAEGALAPLVLVLAAFIVVLPVLRFGALIYTLAPMALAEHPLPGARGAFRLAQLLRPWAMAEVFVVGVAVALVKIADLAKVGLGPAFWALCALVLVNLAYDQIMSGFTVWKTLEARDAG